MKKYNFVKEMEKHAATTRCCNSKRKVKEIIWICTKCKKMVAHWKK